VGVSSNEAQMPQTRQKSLEDDEIAMKLCLDVLAVAEPSKSQ